jgi:hypothetical protein
MDNAFPDRGNGPPPAPSAVSAAPRTFRRGDNRHGITLAASADLMRVTIFGEPSGAELVECFRDAYASGALTRGMATLVDLTRFDGRIDWSAIAAIGKLAPWGRDPARPPRVAYLAESAWFAALLKLVAVIYPHSTHRQFADEASAMEWLGAR